MVYYTLGIHLGHDSSCALVCDGVLIAAVQLERISRKKHDGIEILSNRLPINKCLEAGGITINDVNLIVSSFQAISYGGFGLHQPLIEPEFNLFDPWDKRHFVLSHHLAHAYCAFGSSGFNDAAVIICDLAGSTTLDGQDFYKSFEDWYLELTSIKGCPNLQTECLSIYNADFSGLTLKYRNFTIPHNAPETFVQSVGSLYDNVTRFVFKNENAHGQLMALAAFGKAAFRKNEIDEVEIQNQNNLSVSDIVEISSDYKVTFQNGWQHKVPWGRSLKQYETLANVCQLATEHVLNTYAQIARNFSNSSNIAVAGGVFLNILANTRISESNLFEKYFVPSAPHDAGISVGCAFYGDSLNSKCHAKRQIAIDRLGLRYPDSVVEAELFQFRHILRYSRPPISQVASMIAEGAIIGRWAGRSEFGPRALGGRSILGSPLLEKTKTRLNNIKGRQNWRPVAPIVIQDRLEDFFIGKQISPYMSFAYQIRPEYVNALVALSHPDNSTRAQTHSKEVDENLYQLLLEFDDLTGFPILVNTSMNGAGEPIVETPNEALNFFITHDDIDALLFDSWLVVRKDVWEDKELQKNKIRLTKGCLISLIFPKGMKKAIVTFKSSSSEISLDLLDILSSLEQGKIIEDILGNNFEITSPLAIELYKMIAIGIVSVVCP